MEPAYSIYTGVPVRDQWLTYIVYRLLWRMCMKLGTARGNCFDVVEKVVEAGVGKRVGPVARWRW